MTRRKELERRVPSWRVVSQDVGHYTEAGTPFFGALDLTALLFVAAVLVVLSGAPLVVPGTTVGADLLFGLGFGSSGSAEGVGRVILRPQTVGFLTLLGLTPMAFAFVAWRTGAERVLGTGTRCEEVPPFRPELGGVSVTPGGLILLCKTLFKQRYRDRLTARGRGSGVLRDPRRSTLVGPRNDGGRFCICGRDRLGTSHEPVGKVGGFFRNPGIASDSLDGCKYPCFRPTKGAWKGENGFTCVAAGT